MNVIIFVFIIATILSLQTWPLIEYLIIIKKRNRLHKWQIAKPNPGESE